MGARASWMIERSFTKKKNFLRLGWLWYSKTIFLFFFETFLFSKSTQNYPPLILKKAVFLEVFETVSTKEWSKKENVGTKNRRSSFYKEWSHFEQYKSRIWFCCLCSIKTCFFVSVNWIIRHTQNFLKVLSMQNMKGRKQS